MILKTWVTPVLAGAVLLCMMSPASAVERGPLRVGAARVDITPPVNPAYPPSGRYDHEHLYVRAIVLDNGLTRAALLNADTAHWTEEVYGGAVKQIAELLKCPAANIVMSATHSHSAVPSGPGTQTEAAAAPLIAALVEASRQAQSKLEPALVGFGTGFSYLNVSRDTVNEQTHLWTQGPNLNAASDKTVAVITFTKPTGEPIAAWVNYAMHAINGYLVGITSADFPGAACRYVEKQFDDKMIMVWSQGASGDQNPLLMRSSTNALASITGVKITGYELVREDVEAPLRDGKVPYGKLDPKVADTLERWMESEGQLLGEEVIRVMSNTRDLKGNVTIAGAQTTLTCPGRTRTNTGREGQPGTYKDGDPVNFRLGMLGIGDIAVTSVNAELYSMIWQRLKKMTPMANTVMATISNGRANSGYVPNDAAFGAYTFQVLASRLKPGCAEQGIANTLADLVGQYTGTQAK